MGKVNKDWHAAHPMPRNASDDQRVAWHVAQSAACGCRRIEGGVKAMLEARGYIIEDGKVAVGGPTAAEGPPPPSSG